MEAVGASALRDPRQSAARVEEAADQGHRGWSSSGSPRVGVRSGVMPPAGGDSTPTRDDDDDNADDNDDDDEVSPLRELRGLFGGLSIESPGSAVPSHESVIDVVASFWSPPINEDESSASVPATFRIDTPPWVATTATTTTTTDTTTAASGAPSHEDYQQQADAVGASLFLPWWDVSRDQIAELEESYLVRTSMKSRSGEGLLVDPGSPDNLVGSAWSKRMATLAHEAGVRPATYEPYSLEVGGVGQGSMQCHSKVTHSIVVPTVGSNDREGHLLSTTFTAPEMESDRVPALLGLKSLMGMRAIMVMDPERPRLIIPGPGGVRYDMSPGTRVHPLEHTHSGHLLLPCSEFARHPDGEVTALISGVPPDTTTTTPTTTTPTTTTTTRTTRTTTATATQTAGASSAAAPSGARRLSSFQ